MIDIKDPITGTMKKHEFRFYNEENIYVGFANTIENSKNEYIIPNDSINFGYVASVQFLNRNVDVDTIVTMRVGNGSEFKVGNCWLRVVKVEYRTRYDSDSIYTAWPFALFQVLRLPKYCICQNRKLKKFEEKMQDPVFRRKATSFGLKTEGKMKEEEGE